VAAMAVVLLLFQLFLAVGLLLWAVLGVLSD
jgi:hypothetical protein